MDQVTGKGAVAQRVSQRLDGGSHGGPGRGRELHLDGRELPAGLDQEVDFRAGRCPPEVNLGVDAACCILV